MANQHYADEFYDKAVRAAVSAAIVSQKANVCPFTIRLAWHSSGTHDASAGNGGSHGATMRFAPEIDDSANAGLALMQDILKPVKEKFPDLSYADLWTVAGTQAVRLMGGPEVPFRYGRTDEADGTTCPAVGRLPDATQGAEHLRAVFGRMGFNDEEIVALSGAHTVGSCHRLRSGFDGPWTTNPLKFDNEYFVNLLEKVWVKKAGSDPEQYMDVETGALMMLPTDICLIEDEAFLPYVKAYASDEALFFADFAKAFGKLISNGCPAHCLSDSPVSAAAAKSAEKDFRDLAMHGSVERMKEVMAVAADDSIDVNATEAHSGRTAAHKAAFFGHATVIAYLASLEDGTTTVVDWNAVDADGDTPLHDAARFGHLGVVEELTKAGADPSLKNKAGKLPVDLAAANGKDALVKHFA